MSILKPTDSQTTIRVLNSELGATENRINEIGKSANKSTTSIEYLEETLLGTIALDPDGKPVYDTDDAGNTLYSDGQPVVRRNKDGLIITKAEIQELKATKADIAYLNANYLDAVAIATNYLSVDLANMTTAIANLILAKTGAFTGTATAVKLVADVIDADTIAVSKLILRGDSDDDNLIYQINALTGAVESSTATAEQLRTHLDGKCLVAKSVTADEIYVSDLKAFGATIGGWTITDNSIHTNGKTSYNSATKGTYLGSNGNFGIGSNSGSHVQYDASTGTLDIVGNLKLTGGLTVASDTDLTDLTNSFNDFEASANDSIEEIRSSSASKIDSRTNNGFGYMNWKDDALQIVGINGANYYATEIGGNGIDFKYGANESDAKTVAKINQNQLEIKQTIVFDEMKVGKWAWTIDNNDSLMLRWAGDN